MKVIIHYKNGKKFTINTTGLVRVGWGKEYVHVFTTKWDYIKDVLFLEEVDKDHGIVKYHFNPNTPMSIIPNVMTAQQRAKANRNGVMQMVNNTLSRLKDWKNYGQ